MKLVRKFGVHCGCAAVLVAFILQLAGTALSYTISLGSASTTTKWNGSQLMFTEQPFGTCLSAWIITLIGLLFAVALSATAFIKTFKYKKILAKAGLCVGLALFAAGIVCFFPGVEAGFGGTGAGWVMAGILLIFGASAIGFSSVLTVFDK